MSRWIAPLLPLALWACGGTPEPPARPDAATPEPIEGANGQSAAASPPPGAPADGIAARINNEILTWKDVDDSLRQVKPADLTQELRLSKRRELAEERLFLQSARQNQVTVTEQELDDYLRREMKNFKDEDEFEKYLRITNQTRTEYRETKRRAYLVYKLYRHLLQKAFTNPDQNTPGLLIDFVPPEEIRRYYDENREQFKAFENVTVLRIGLQFSTPAEEAAKEALARSVLRKLSEGAELLFLAHFYTDVRRGGEIFLKGLTREEASKFFDPKTVTLLFETLSPGQVSDVVKDRNTWNIFRVEQRVNQKEETFEEAQPKIRSLKEHQKREENRKKLRDHLKRSAYLWPPDLFESE
jgi:hypothetical protein